jgi:hypothetical protein
VTEQIHRILSWIDAAGPEKLSSRELKNNDKKFRITVSWPAGFRAKESPDKLRSWSRIELRLRSSDGLIFLNGVQYVLCDCKPYKIKR